MPEIALPSMQCFRAGEFSRFVQSNCRFAGSTSTPHTDRKKQLDNDWEKNKRDFKST